MIGIIGAMDEEVEQLVEVMEITREETKACMTFKAGKLAGKDVVIVRSGIGKVNAAACTQILVDDFKADYIINTGIAGSLKAEIDIADVVISSDVHQIANIEKKVPLEWITDDDFVTDDLIHYIRPLIQAELSPIMVDGLPRHLNINA